MTPGQRPECDLPAVLHSAILDYAQTDHWPIMGDDMHAAAFLAARIESALDRSGWRCPGDPIECRFEAALGELERSVTVPRPLVRDPDAQP
jgi:hypothetical protein